MSETRRTVSLDAALGAWPDTEKTQAEWEAKALDVEARVGAGDLGATASSISEEQLLAPPLGQMAEGGHNSASPDKRAGQGAPMTMQNRERDRRSLQDLAKLAQMTPPPPSVSSGSGVLRAAEAQKDDSGIVDLAAAAAADPGADARARSTPLASQGLFDEEPASVRPPPSSAAALPQQPIPSLPPVLTSAPTSMTPSAPVVAAAPSSAPPGVARLGSVAPSQLAAVPAEKKKGNGQVLAILVGGVVAAAAVAAGVVVYAKHRHAADAAALAARTEVPAKADAPRPQEPQKTAENETTPAAQSTLDPNALPTAAAPHAAKVARPAAKGGGGAAARPELKDELKLAQKDLPAQASGPAGDLGDAIQKAAGPKNAPEQTAAAATTGPQFAPGSVPQKPSQGAITGAIGSVLPQARQCLGPDDPVTYATITFASPGNVQSVTLSGGSASKADKASCIKDALSKARVASFAEPTFTTRVPVRP